MTTRIRTIKPAFFRHGRLYDAEKATGLPLRLAFIGLWIIADRDGRFEWKPRELKPDIMPYDDGIDFSSVMDALAQHSFVLKYKCDGEEYGLIPSWKKHQTVNVREAPSRIPAPHTIGDAGACSDPAPTGNVSAPPLHMHAHVEQEREVEEEQKLTTTNSALSSGSGEVFVVVCADLGITPTPSNVLVLQRQFAELLEKYTLEEITAAGSKAKDQRGKSRISSLKYLNPILAGTRELAALPSAPTAIEPTDDRGWTKRLELFRETGTWLAKWGPRWGEPGCLCPGEIYVGDIPASLRRQPEQAA